MSLWMWAGGAPADKGNNDAAGRPEGDALEEAADDIAALCGCPEWDYPQRERERGRCPYCRQDMDGPTCLRVSQHLMPAPRGRRGGGR